MSCDPMLLLIGMKEEEVPIDPYYKHVWTLSILYNLISLDLHHYIQYMKIDEAKFFFCRRRH